MKHTKLFEQFISEANTMSAPDMIQYLNDVTPEESDVPDYFMDQVTDSNATFTLKKVKISDLLKSDKSLKDYVLSGEDRYGDDAEEGDYIPYQDEVYQPIVIFNNEVIDGYSRTSELYKSSDKYIEAWTNT